MKRNLTEEELDAILLMVRESSTLLKAHDSEFFEEYEETVRRSKTVLPSDANGDDFTSPFLVTEVLLAPGLWFLGMASGVFLKWICNKALDRGFKKVLGWLNQQKPDEVVEEASKAIVLVLPLPQGVDEEQLRRSLGAQLEALLKNPQITSKISSR